MQYPISHPRWGRLALSLAAMALSLLLVLAARAGAESLPAPSTVEEDATAVVDPAASATEAAGEEQAPPAPSADPAPTSTDSSPTTAVSEISSTASKAAESAVQSLPRPKQPDTVAPSSARAAGPVAETRRDVAGVVGSATATAKAAVRTLDRARPIEGVRALANDQLQKVGGTLRDGLDRFAPAISRIPSLAAGGVDPNGEASPPHPSPLPSVESPPSTVGPRLEQVVPLDGGLPQPPAAPAATALLRLLTPDASGAQGRPAPFPAAGPIGVPPDRPGQPAETGSPPSDPGPTPLPDLPQVIASGASSSFVPPIAALLALLALAAPAILRRLGEAPDFRAPAPFVCALERPG